MPRTAATMITDTQHAQLEALAAEQGITVSEYLREAVGMYGRITPTVRDLVQSYAEGLGISPTQVVESFLVDCAARAVVTEELLGEAKSPFRVDAKGKWVTGEELFAALCRQYRADAVKVLATEPGKST